MRLYVDFVPIYLFFYIYIYIKDERRTTNDESTNQLRSNPVALLSSQYSLRFGYLTRLHCLILYWKIENERQRRPSAPPLSLPCPPVFPTDGQSAAQIRQSYRYFFSAQMLPFFWYLFNQLLHKIKRKRFNFFFLLISSSVAGLRLSTSPFHLGFG